jgi:DNA-binding NarL/FixJ family response regulator
MKKIKVMVVDDQILFMECLRILLETQAEDMAVAERSCLTGS